MATASLKVGSARLWVLWLWLLAASGAFATGCATDAAQQREMVNPGETQQRVASFSIDGTNAFDAGTLKDGLATQEDPGWRTAISWMPLLGAEHQYFNRIQWERDQERIRTFYRRHGYFNVQISGSTVSPTADNEAVRLRLTINEGQPTRISQRIVEGLEPLSESARREVLRDLPLQEGEIFTEEEYQQTRSMLVERLRRRSYAYAEISGRAVIDPTESEAEIFYFLDPGPKVHFGDVYIIGTDEIDESHVREALPIESGDAFSPQIIERTQNEIYDLGVFSLVSVLPANEASDRILERVGLSRSDLYEPAPPGQEERAYQGEPPPEVDPEQRDIDTGPEQVEEPMDQLGPEAEQEVEDVREAEAQVPGPMGISDVLASAQQQAETRVQLDRELPVIIQLKESRLWNVELGAGLSVEINRTAAQLQGNWSSRNFLGGLRKLEHTNRVGYAWASNVGNVGVGGPGLFGGRRSEAANEGVFFESRLEFRQPQFLERKTLLRSQVSLRRAIEVGYTVWNPQATVGIERRFFDDLTLGFNYHVSFYRYENVGESLLAAPDLGVDFEQQYLLEWFEQRIALDLRDNPLNPQSGFYSSLSLQEAGSYLLGGDFRFLKVIWGNEAYLPVDLLTRWVFAGRIRVGAIYNREPVEQSAEGTQANPIPIENRLYGGGSNSLRGLGRNNLSFFRVGSFDPTNPVDIETVEVIPVGGLTLAEASIEPRFRIMRDLAGIGPLWGLAYYDVATVLNDQLYFSTDASDALGIGTADFGDLRSSLVSSIGAGAFWLTPVGPVRADFAVTLNDLSNDPRFRTCGPTSRVRDQVSQTGRSDCEFLPVERDPVQQQINVNYSFFIGVGHSF